MLKKILFIVLFISVTSLSANPYPYTITSSDIIIIRVYSPLSKTEKGVIKVYKNNDPVFSIDLEPYTERDDNNCFLKIREVLNKYTTEGYSIVSTQEYGIVAYGNKVFSTYILEKK
ncbi:MAG: hypothetical protein JWM14_1090 [Chitinophagaceae bacterium]|nr:hypothetical protein [Chitinophagaceae bacterium]